MSTNRRGDLLKACVKELQCCIEYVQRYADNPSQQLDVLKNIAKEYCELDIQYSRAQEAREATDRHFDNQENDCTEDVQQIYDKYLAELPAAASYANHSIWRKINNAAEGVQPSAEEHSDDDSSVDGVEAEDVNGSIDEEGIIPSQFEPPIDPITKRPIENPCKNRKCGHVYEFDTIMDHLKKMKLNKKLRCPYIGCANSNMKPSFIVKDNALRRQIENFVANRSAQLDSSSQASLIL